MDFWFSIFMGFVQGIAEFLPISSSGHLAIMHNFFGEMFADMTPQEELLFDILVHLATLLAVFVAFWRDIKGIIAAFFGFFTPKGRQDAAAMPARRFVLLLIAATLPLCLVLFFHRAVDELMRNMYFVGGMLLVTACLLFLADRLKPGRKTEKSARFSDALFVGFMQVLAVFPGLSRSGATISAGMIRGYDRAFAVKFSFLMSIPAIIAATLLHVADAVKEGIDWGLVASFIPGMVVAAVVGYCAIILVRMLVAKGKFGAFAYYCAVVGATVIIITAVT